MAIVQISRITQRKGLEEDLPQPLAPAELGWAVDTRQLYIGPGTIAEGSPDERNNVEILTEYSDILATQTAYTYTGQTATGYSVQTGPSAGAPPGHPAPWAPSQGAAAVGLAGQVQVMGGCAPDVGVGHCDVIAAGVPEEGKDRDGVLAGHLGVVPGRGGRPGAPRDRGGVGPGARRGVGHELCDGVEHPRARAVGDEPHGLRDAGRAGDRRAGGGL